MGKRKLPFGYEMVMGEIALKDTEAAIVREIFNQYISGASYNELTEKLNGQNVRYDADKLWNKNMIARILEDSRYTGQDQYPKVIDAEEYYTATEKRNEKQNISHQTEAQKVLRKLCKTSVTKALENSVLTVMNRLICGDEKVYTETPSAKSLTVTEIGRELDRVMQIQPIDEDRARTLICELASAQYDALGYQEYETKRIMRILSNEAPMEKLKAEILESCVSGINISGSEVRLLLKNGQTIKGAMRDDSNHSEGNCNTGKTGITG